MPTSRRQRYRESQEETNRWRKVRNAELEFGRALRRIAKHVADIVRAFPPDDPVAMAQLETLLRDYSRTLGPWARIQARRMVLEVVRRDEAAWIRTAATMARNLRKEIEGAPTGDIVRESLTRAVSLITSLPQDAAERVHQLTLEGRIAGATRAKEISDMIMATGNVTRARANLIARTEVARTASLLTQARAEHIGSPGYIWRTVRDPDVRKDHQKLEGKFIKWDEPPIADSKSKTRAHAGQIYNCFTGSTLVGPISEFRRVFRARYCGPLIVLETKHAAIEVTPNHPILTTRGWVVAGRLKEADQLVRMPMDGLHFIQNNVDQRYATFEKVFEAFDTCSNRESAIGSVFDFYGDPTGPEVDIVRTNSVLPVSNYSDLVQEISDLFIPISDRRIVATVLSSILEVLEPFSASFLDPEIVVNTGFPLCDDSVRFGSSSERDTILSQNAFDGDAADSVFTSDRRSSHSRQVLGNDFFGWKTDTVVGISSRWFSGHVYTAETEPGYYTISSARIVSKNCRCVPEPVIPDTFD